MLDHWLRPLAPPDDYRFHVTIDGEPLWVLMERLPWDSEFFSMQIARLNMIARPGSAFKLRESSLSAIKALQTALEHARRSGIEYVLAQVDAQDIHAIRTLCGSGFDLIETRVHYHSAISPASERYPSRLATEADIASLARTARIMVNPFDRFHSDPEISEALADKMMERWVEASIRDGFADATIVPDEPSPEAFFTLKAHKEHWNGWGLKLTQPVLSAVAPRHKGWYMKLISEANEFFLAQGAQHSFVTTQVTNNAAIRSLEKLGYRFGKGEHVFRRILRSA
ncbi:hypothetical protein CO612_00715 [Lysobacteraceae bacterium NML71-0210]|nr:hypothetical protein CO612_00715 [Xanthomonadaceae bacterium NML71-0210]